MPVRALLTVVGLLAVCTHAHAEAPASRRVELDLGGVAQANFGNVSVRSASDVVEYSDLELSAGPVVGARLRFGAHLALGGLVGLGFTVGSHYTSVALRPAVQLRYLPFGSRAGGLWLGPDVGLVHCWDRIDGDESGRSSATAAAFGLSAGAGVKPAPWFALWFALRGGAEAYSRESHPPAYTLSRGPAALVSLALGLSYLP